MTAEETGEMIEMGPMNKIISGRKGKGGRGGYRAPVESPNTLQSIQYVTLTDVVSEGPIVGLYDNDKSIYLNETPLRTSGGSLTMQDVSWNIRLGTPDQTALPYDAGAETEVGVSAEVTNLYPKGEGPDSGRFQFSVTNETATRLRITMGVQALYETRLDQEHAGDMVPASVGYRIVIADGNGKTIKDYKDTLKGKTTSQYFWDRLFDLSGPAPWLVTVYKTTPDSRSSALNNDLYISSYTAIVGYSFTYPNTALVSITASAETFSGTVPNRIYRVKGLKVQVPNNYDPETRAYSGIWDGTFKLAWTDNPAWVLYDIVTNDRYGVAKYLPRAFMETHDLCDKWYLYRIAQICDEMVPDGKGGQEPRYTFNGQIMGSGECKDVIQSIASVFHGMTYWSSGLIYARADYPSDPIRTITQANVVGGVITYSSASMQERHSVAQVTWHDPDDLGRAHVEIVYDWDAYQRIGYRPIQVTAYGCYSRGQAHRHGLWILATEAKQWTATVEMGLDGFDLLPGDIVKLSDPAWMGYRAGGRIKSLAGSTVMLDAPFEGVNGESYQISVCDDEGTEETIPVVTVNDAVVIVERAFTKTFVPNAVWSMAGTQAEPRQFRVQNIKETSKGTIQVQFLEYDPNKYLKIEQGLRLEDPPSRRTLKDGVEPPVNLSVVETTATVNGRLVQKALFSWQQNRADFAVTGYRVQYTDPLGNVKTSGWSNEHSFELTNVMSGEWTFKVQAATFDGRHSGWADKKHSMAGISALNPSNVAELHLSEWGYMQKDGVHVSNVDVTWGDPAGMKAEAVAGFEIYYRYSDGARWQKYATTDADERSHAITNVQTGKTIQVMVRTRSKLDIRSSGVSASLPIVGKDQPPAAPKELTASVGTKERTHIALKWEPVSEPDIAGYRVYLDDRVVVEQTADTSAALKIVEMGSHALYVVSIDNSKQLSERSNTVSVTIRPPAAPASISAVASRTDRCTIDVTWAAVNESDIAGYTVQRDGVEIARLTPDCSVSAVIAESGLHKFSVQAVTVDGLTSPWTSKEVYFSVLPNDVGNFSVKQSPLKKSSLIFTWDAVPGNDIDYYEIRRGNAWDGDPLVARTQGTSFTLENWVDDGEFSFCIKAHCIGGYYSQFPNYCAIVISMVPSPPSNLTASQSVADPAIVNVSWKASPDLDVTSYEIRDGLAWNDAKPMGTTSGTMLTINCQNSHEYNFLVRANNSAGYVSDVISVFCEATLEPPTVTGFNAVQDGDTVDLWWDKSTSNGVDWYEVREGFSWESGALIATGISNTALSVPVSFERGYNYLLKAHSRVGYYSDQPAKAPLVVSNLSPKNVFVERDYIALLEDGTGSHNNTAWRENPCTWATVGGRWSDYPGKRWMDFGGQYVLSLAAGQTSGTWYGHTVFLNRTVKAKITADFQTLNSSTASARLQYRSCDQDKNGPDGYGPWTDFHEHTETLSKIQFRVVMKTNNAAQPPFVTLLHVVVDMPDVVKSGRISVPAAGATIEYGFEYAITPTVVVSADTATARAVIVGVPGKTNCIVKVLDNNNTPIAGTVNWTSYGY